MLSQNYNNTNESQQPLNVPSYTPVKPQYNQGFNQEQGDQLDAYNEVQLQDLSQYKGDFPKHEEILSDSQYRSCYPTQVKVEHIIKTLLTCGNKDDTYVSKINKAQNQVPINFLDKDKDIFKDKIVELKIEETTQLELDKNLLHPFVKVHIIDMERGNYIEKIDQKQAAVVKTETRTIPVQKDDQDDDQQDNDSSWKRGYCNYIPSFSTNCCDLRTHGNSKARWDYTMLINEQALHVYDQKNVILFEILDFNPKFLRNKEERKIDKDNFYRVAWGYLRPIGIGGNHFGRVKVQLYKYVFNTLALPSNYNKTLVPLVYFDFIWPQKKAYNGQLQIVLNAIEKPMITQSKVHARNVFEDESKDNMLEKSRMNEKQQIIQDEEQSEADKRKAARKRNDGEKCFIPDKVLCKFPSAPLGCFRLQFSYSGKYLAAACTEKNSKTYIKIFETEDEFQEVFRYRGHANLIHELSWFETDDYLLSCSSDFTAKVWHIPKDTNDKITEDQSETQFQLATLNHSSYVYSAKFHPKVTSDNLIIVTACFDAKIRIFFVNMYKRGVQQKEPQNSIIISSKNDVYDPFSNLLNHRHPNSIDFDRGGRLYVGDSLGVVHTFDLPNVNDNVNNIKKIQKIENKQLEGDPINQVHFVEESGLIVHSRDNCLRKFDLKCSTGIPPIQAQYTGSTSQKYPIHSRVSPDCVHVLSGSEDGKPYLWDISGNSESVKQLEYDINGPITDVSWCHGYHMIAVSGFSDEFPIIVYYFEKDTNYIQEKYNSIQQQIAQTEKNVAKFDDDTGNKQPNNYDPKQYRNNYQQLNY